jgi:TolB protein
MYEVMQGQEVRSHFHGHIGLQNVSKPFAPWFFGPKKPVLGDPDLTNGDVFAFANKVGAFATYVHPLDSDMDPFSDAEIDNIPLELVSDGVLEEKMGLELVCAWTSPLGNSALWYRLLNIGRPIAAMSGTDGWVDFHRTPAMGTGRAYIRPLETVAGEHNGDPVLAGAIAGRSFVTTGPVIIFSLDNGAKPGDITENGKQTWELTLASTVDVDRVEIILNGQVVQTLDGLAGAQTRSYNGQLDLPQGGWVAARAYATEPRVDNWPSMHARPFAHSSPIWIGQVGSTNTVARATAAADLIRAINTAEQRARDAYGDRPMPRLYQRFEQARIRLRSML